jgi:hypothetical protein
MLARTVMMMSSTMRYCHVFWWIRGAQGFPLKEEINGKWKMIMHAYLCDWKFLLVVCMFADWLLNYMSSI